MKFTLALEKIGLSNDEAIIYETLLEKGQLNILKLSTLTQIHRPNLYKSLPKLVKYGVVSEVKKGKRVEYIAAQPEKLEPLLEQSKKLMDNIVQNLSDRYSKNTLVPNIEMYYGETGISDIFMDLIHTLNKGDTYYRYSLRKDLNKSFISQKYIDLSREKKIEVKVITNKSWNKIEIPSLSKNIRLIEDDGLLNITKLIYTNKVAYIDFNNLTGFIITNDRIYEAEKNIFTTLYKTLPR